MERTAYTNGLRAFADWLDAHPEVPLPNDGKSSFSALGSFVLDDDQARETLAAVARALPGKVDKDYSGESYMRVHGVVDGIHVSYVCNREAVCERVVVGQRTVSKEVPVAYEEREVTEDVVEWRCDDGIMRASERPGPDEAAGVSASELTSEVAR